MSEITTSGISSHFNLRTTPEAAFFSLKPSLSTLGRMPTLDEVKDFLNAKGIKYGIEIPVIEKIIQEKSLGLEIIVAKALSPVLGKDAVIELLLNPDAETKPKLHADGTVDYKEIGAIIQVTPGTIIAVKHPPTAGIPGMDIFGVPVRSTPGKDCILPAGLNTKILEDTLTLVADKTGYLYRQSGRLCIGLALKIPGNVDFNSGNIHFDGDVEITGSVTDGFTVDATGNIAINGEADGAMLISQRGNISIASGAFGKSKSLFQAQETITIAFARQARIKCNKLIVQKSLQDCQVETQSIESSSPECMISGGKYFCFGSATIQHVGTEGARTEFLLLDEVEEELQKNLARLQKEAEQLKTGLDVHDRKLRSIKSLISKAPTIRIPTKVMLEIKTSGEAFQKLKAELDKAVNEKVLIEVELAKPKERSSKLKIKGEVKGPVHLNMFHFKKVLTPEDSHKEFVFVPDKGIVEFEIR